jgi:hypothetical protein
VRTLYRMKQRVLKDYRGARLSRGRKIWFLEHPSPSPVSKLDRDTEEDCER